MRRILVAGAAAVCLLVEGAGPASAAEPTSVTAASTSVSSAASARAAAVTGGVGTAGVAAPGAQNVAFVDASTNHQSIGQQPERRRTPSRKKRRSAVGRFFGVLAFMFIGLPLLVVAALVMFFMVRRGRKQREQAFAQQQRRQTQNGPYQAQQGPYPGASGTNDVDGQNPTHRY